MRKISYFLIFVIVQAFCGCNDKLITEKLTHEIMGLIIDKNAKAIPPPPKFGTIEEVDEKLLDSIVNLPLKVAIYPIMSDIDLRTINMTIPYEYREIVQINSKISSFELSNISSKKGHYLFLADSSAVKRDKEYKDFDLLFNFSSICFNKERTRAIVEIGVSRSALAGYSVIYCLVFDNEKWRVAFSKINSEW